MDLKDCVVYIVHHWEGGKESDAAKIIGVFSNFASARKSLKESAKKYSKTTCLKYITEENKKLIVCCDDKDGDNDSVWAFFAIKKLPISD